MSKEIISYHNFAYYYNQLIPTDFYDNVVNRLVKIKKFDKILDLACGSGTLCFKLKTNNNEVTGLDLSQEMLMIAQEYNLNNKKGVQFINQDLTDLHLQNETYDLITCTLDSFNYIELDSQISKIITNVANSLVNDGYFYFDLLTQFYIDEIVNDYYQCEEVNDFEYVWQVERIDDTAIRHDLQILCDEEQYFEQHLQYIHDFNVIENILSNNGLVIVEKYNETNELNTSKPSRISYLCKKEQ